MNPTELCLFALDASRDFGQRVASRLGITLSPHEERTFEDGEHKARPLANVRGRDVFVVQSLHGDGEQSVNDKLCRLLFFIGALKDASAAYVTAVVPYLAYARNDRKSQSRDPVTTASHGLFVGDAEQVLADDALNGIVVTDSVPPFRLREGGARSKLVVLPSAGLFADAIQRIHGAGSITQLLEG